MRFFTVMPHVRPRRVLGAALLIAMTVVALVATLAATALTLQWRDYEVERAERSRVQIKWILSGALDFARLILREDARAGVIDHLGEPWAVPLHEARLTSFLAAQQGISSSAEDDLVDAFLSGQIVDLQARYNLANLVDGSLVNESQIKLLARLFSLLKLSPGELVTLSANLHAALAPKSQETRDMPLLPNRVQDLTWLGLSAATVATIEPYVTILPIKTPVNLNTASAEVIYAAIGGTLSDARKIVQARDRQPLNSVNEARTLLGTDEWSFPEGDVGVSSRFFQVDARVRLDNLTITERSVVQRTGLTVQTLSRERAPAEEPSLAVR